MTRNQHPAMAYRRFGRTGLELSCITLGGMRYVHGWDAPRDVLPQDMLDQCARVVDAALAAGINHIETAYGYGKSEHCYGRVLNEILRVPRDRYYLMTKAAPATAAEARRTVREQLAALRTDRIDLYAWHGINTPGLLTTALAPGGAVDELRAMQAAGIIGAVGFSTHGRLETVIEAIRSDRFDFVNLHYYYFYQRLRGAVDLAHARDMGVFIISPNDKGGQLFRAPPLLHRLCAPWTPIQCNARWCLRTPAVQTLSFGLDAPAQIPEAVAAMAGGLLGDPTITAAAARLDARLGEDPVAAWEGWELQDDPSGINIPEVLRFRRLLRCYDMRDFGVYRYNMLESKGHWFPGHYASPDLVDRVQAHRAPPGIDVRALLTETHAALYRRKGG
jgi:uncharacterized protein